MRPNSEPIFMKYFLSCDWGTTSFRLRLANQVDGKIIAEEKSDQGIAATFGSWQQTGKTDTDDRVAFYLNIVELHIKTIEKKTNQSLARVKIVMSGMASSSIGITDIPYATGAIAVNGSGINTTVITATATFDHDVLIVSGVRILDDVMRGEETQLIGCIPGADTIENELYIFPGTHSKHILVKNNQMASIKTYMTGEVFELLSQKSILKNSVEISEKSQNLTVFKKGVRDALDESILHTIFKVRTNHLFDIYSKEENYNYLSGLLIGAELAVLKATDAETINLICGANLQNYYVATVAELGLSKTVNTFPMEWVDEAAVRGQLKIARQLEFLT